MAFEEEAPASKRRPASRDLSPLGLAELDACVVELEAEIARVRQAIAAKRTHLGSAEGLFRKPAG
jgi:uncharacterized small protein (DUF1192 family)